MEFNFTLLVSLVSIFFLLKIDCAATNDEPTGASGLTSTHRDGSVQEQRLRHLEGKLNALESKVESLTHELVEQRDMLNRNIAEQKFEKTMLSIISGDQDKAKEFWKETLDHTEDSDVQRTLRYLIVSTYANTRKYFYPIMDFLVKNELYSGFPTMYNELVKYGNVYGGGEIFVFGRILRHTCGTRSDLYKGLPKIVQDIGSGPVLLQNVENHGYMVAHEHKPCKNKVSFYECNEGYPKQNIFLHKIVHHDEEEEAILIDSRAQWTFTLPQEEGLDLPLSSGLLLKNVQLKEFVIVKLRGSPSIFSKNDTFFSSYYANDRQYQYLPELEVEKGNEEILIGLREKYVNNTVYFFGEKFHRSKIIDLMKSSLATDKRDFYWHVHPVSEDHASGNFMQPSGCTF